jgi:hypothetical protein
VLNTGNIDLSFSDTHRFCIRFAEIFAPVRSKWVFAGSNLMS